MVYLDDRLPNHPKLLAAAEILGGGEAGYLKALAGFTALLCHAAQFPTDGYLTTVAIRSVNHISGLADVAEAFATVGLLEPINGGYQFHDWRQWNHKTASQITATKYRKLEKARLRQAAWRARQKAD